MGSKTLDGRDVRAGPPRDRGRMTRTTITIDLELDETTDCPSGSLHLPDGATREFHGWLGLAAALGSLARAPEPANPPDTSNGKERP